MRVRDFILFLHYNNVSINGKDMQDDGISCNNTWKSLPLWMQFGHNNITAVQREVWLN